MLHYWIFKMSQLVNFIDEKKSLLNKELSNIIWNYFCTQGEMVVQRHAKWIIHDKMDCGSQPNLQPINHSMQNHEKTGKNFENEMKNMDFFISQKDWAVNGFEMSAFCGQRHAQRLFKTCIEKISPSLKDIFLSIATRIFFYNDILTWIGKDKELFRMFFKSPSYSFLKIISHQDLNSTLKLLVSHQYSDEFSMLYDFLKNRKKLINRLEAQSIVSRFSVSRYDKPQHEKVMKLLPKIQDADNFYVQRGPTLSIHISKSLFYQKMNDSGEPIDKFQLRNFLVNLIGNLSWHEKEKMGLEELHLLNSDGNEKNYMIILQVKDQILFDYKEMFEQICLGFRHMLNNVTQDTVEKALNHYLISKKIPEKEEKAIQKIKKL